MGRAMTTAGVGALKLSTAPAVATSERPYPIKLARWELCALAAAAIFACLVASSAGLGGAWKREAPER